MYNCSNAFHSAIANGNEQTALLLFSDCIFSDDDIVIDNGIDFKDNFNVEEDITIGQATSNEISFSLVNEERLLNSYAFGDFQAWVGVLISEYGYNAGSGELCRCVSGNNTYIGYNNYPYVKRNGVATGSQPGYAVQSIVAYDGKVYCCSGDGRYIVYDDASGSNVSGSSYLNSFMANKTTKINRKGVCISKSGHTMNVWELNRNRNWEFCPWGFFTAERPKAPDKIQIDMTCYDFMLKFDKDMADVTVTYPITIKNLFKRLCEVAEVEYVLPSPFINGDATIAAQPEDFANVTMREVLKWIAEAACANARFNRNGKLTLQWIRTGTGQVLGSGNYSTFDPYWYKTKKITKLCNKDTQGSTSAEVGSGSETYLIQDNPLLRGVT